ncbi:coiled-coil domain-containing protein 170-like isoform X2 [Rhopilema esculentum]|uniref:coiled-coil domain-containing protein 170-like isoform X2 n=1 Tax=Rhopilema esculentum TaxID=499914 RepID=UPI0031DAA3FF
MAYYGFDKEYLPRISANSRGFSESRPRQSLRFVDDYENWSDGAIKDKSGRSKHASFSYSKRRPLSADSSVSSSISGLSLKDSNEPADDNFKLNLSDILDSKKDNSSRYSFQRKSDLDSILNTWPHPPNYGAASDATKTSAFAKSLTEGIGLTNQDLESNQKEKLQSLFQERDTLTLQVSHYRQAAETAASDLAAEKVKSATCQDEIKKAKGKISDLQQKIMDLKCEIESGKQFQARSSAMISSLQNRVKDAEDFAVDKENKMSRVDVTVFSLKKELQQQVDEKQKLEISLKHHLKVEEEKTKKAEEWERKLREMCALLANLLGIEAPGGLEAIDLIVSRVKEAVRDFGSLKQKMTSMTHQYQNTDLEVKASRETIMRLVADIGKEQQLSGERLKEIENLTRERDIATQKQRETELELQQVKDNLKHSQEAWSSTRERLADQELRLHEFDKVLATKEDSYHKADIKLKHFKRQLAEILSDVDVTVREKESDILHMIRAIHKSYKEKKSNEEKLQSRVSALAGEISNQRNMQHSTIARATQAENQWQDMNERVKALEGELIAADVERDRLKDDRNKFLAFIDKLSRAMKLDEVAVEAGFDISSDAILLRAEQLSKSETNSLQDRTSTIYSLQRKTKTLKHQLESKDFQLSLSKKKINELEEILKDRGRIENERDDTSNKNSKLQKRCERLQDELSRNKDIVMQLKAKIMEYGEQQIKLEDQKRTIEDLESVVQRLAKSKQKTDKRLAEKRHAFESSEKETKEEIQKTNLNYQQLLNELQETRSSLEETQSREKQLIKFRHALAKLIGLDIEELSVPDYEIISKLEKVVRGYETYTNTVKSLETTLNSMEKEFKHGYSDVKTLLHST